MILSGDPWGAGGSADVDVAGFDADPVLLSDDVWDCNHSDDELFWAGNGLVAGRFGWSAGNGDGGVLRLDCPLSLTITVDPGWNIDTLVWIDGDGTVKDIGFDDPIVFECDVTLPVCRADCTSPTCGDDYLDPGEECDDGNVDDGDGCPNDCDR
jgi:cysteine-rich repeat protein